MTQYEFTFVVGGVSVDDDDVVERIYQATGAVLWRGHDGQTYLEADAEGDGDNLYQLIVYFIERLKNIVPDIRIEDIKRITASMADDDVEQIWQRMIVEAEPVRRPNHNSRT